MTNRLSSSIRNHSLVWGLALVLIVAAIAALLTTQGWKSRVPAFDLVPHIRNTYGLLATGAVPVHGDTGSYGSYKPPGTAWLMAPSALLVADPRFSEYVSTTLLHLATLAGLFLLARACFGAWCASLAVVLYGLSVHGLFLAGSLWPNGRPDFFIWIVYLATRWVTDDNPKFLAAALALWGTGMFVDMAIAPVVFVLPVLWLFYRPSVRLKPLLASGVLVLVLWSPYLHFQTMREFADLRSQLLLQNIFPANHRDAWCDPQLTLVKWQEGTGSAAPAVTVTPEESVPPGPLPGPLARGYHLKEKVLSNFEQAVPAPGADIVLALITAGSLLILSVSRNQVRQGSTFKRLAAGLSLAVQPEERLKKVRLLALGLGVPWVILALVAEPGKPERFWWIWPMQVMFIAAFVTYILPRWNLHRSLVWAAQAVLVFALLGNTFLISRVDALVRTGWEGPSAEPVQVVEYVASQVRAKGRDRAAIGYRTLIYPFMVEYNITNPQYKVGAEFDLLFERSAGISNTDLCAEGTSPDDEYRIVQVRPQAEEWAPRQYFDVRMDDSFVLLRGFDSYQVFGRRGD